MSDVVAVLAIAAACAAGVGVVGHLLLRVVVGRWGIAGGLAAVAVVTALAMVAAVLGAAQAMFLSGHDREVALLACGAAGVVALAVALLLGRRVVAGSAALTAATRALGDGAPFAAPPRPPTSDLRSLADELAATSARLGESRDREAALERSRRELVTWVSHDLRTPLAGMRAMAEALEDGMVADPARYHARMRIEVDRLASMVDDLFELSRISSGTLTLAREPVHLGDLVSDTIAAAEPGAAARGVRLTGREDDPAVVGADVRELSRVVRNLVDNAVRHTPAGGSVAVALRVDDGDAVVGVEDGCGGLAPADLRRVFDVGWRGSDARTPGPDGGAGLGLAIARGIVHAHDGSIEVENMRDGCRFVVRLPLAHPPGGAPRSVPSSDGRPADTDTGEVQAVPDAAVVSTGAGGGR